MFYPAFEFMVSRFLIYTKSQRRVWLSLYILPQPVLGNWKVPMYKQAI